MKARRDPCRVAIVASLDIGSDHLLDTLSRKGFLSAPAGLFIERLISNATGVPARAMPAAQSPHRFKKRRDEWETISEWRRRTASLPLLPVDD
jgi:hypothetical protein